MGRPRKIQPDESDVASDEIEKPAIIEEIPLIMPIAKLLTLTPKQQETFRANGGTTTEN